MATRSDKHEALTLGQYLLLKKRIDEARASVAFVNPKVVESAAVKRAKATIAAHEAKVKALTAKGQEVKAAEHYEVLQTVEFGTSQAAIVKAVDKYVAFTKRYAQRGLQ